jgi:RND family efflux transporter MFP subunit
VTEITVRIGQSVQTGDLLVMLDPRGVQSQYQQAEALYLNAEKQRKKMKVLYETGAISEMQLDEAETGFEVAKANFNSARQSIEITAPFEGVVTDIYVRIGDEVAPGLPIVEIADVGALRLYLEVSSSQAAQLETGQPVEVSSPVDASVVMKGKVFSIADAADQVTRSFEVGCHFPTPPKGFSPGMYVTAEVVTSILGSALVVPSQALLYRSGKVMLYAVDDDSAVLITVTELASGQGRSAIKGNISPGQRVVVVGQKNLTPGTKVREAGK